MADSEFILNDQRFEPGTRTTTKLFTVELADSTPVELQVVVIRGASPGPVFYLGPGVHGDETGSVAITAKLIQSVDPQQLHGTLVVVPVQNPLAFQSHHRLPLTLLLKSPHDQGVANIFQAYPGDPNGNSIQIMTHLIYQQLIANADTGRSPHPDHRRPLPTVWLRPPTRPRDAARRSWDIIRAFGPGRFDNAASTYVSSTTPHVAAARLGAAAFGAELGEGGRVERP